MTADDQVLLSDNFERRLLCVDARTGAERWSFEATARGVGDVGRRSQIMPAGLPSVTIVGDRVIVITLGGRVVVLALATGDVIAEALVPYAGCYAVTDTSIFFKQAFRMAEFDHRTMVEVDRLEYRADVEPLYGRNEPTVNAVCISDASVVWTTMHGALMAVSRKPGQSGKHTVWSELIPGALMPLGDAPVTYDRYLYFTKRGEAPELLCFRGA